MGELIVVTGPPGAGKSSVAACLADHFHPCALVPGDDFFAFLRTGMIAPWLPEAHDQNTAVIEAAASASGRLSRHCPAIFDGVVGPWFVDAFLEHCGLDHLYYAVLLPPLADCVERVRTRTGHGFTDLDAARRMWQDFNRANIAERHKLSDPAADAPETARRIAAGVSTGELRYTRYDAASILP